MKMIPLLFELKLDQCSNCDNERNLSAIVAEINQAIYDMYQTYAWVFYDRNP